MYFSFVLAAIAAIYNINTISLPSAKAVSNALTSPFGHNSINGASLSYTASVWIIFGASIALCTAAAWVYYIVAMRRQQMKILKNAPSLVALGFLGYGISINNTLEAFKAFFLRSSGSFKRTPKYAITGDNDTWRDKKYQVPVDFTSVIEVASISFAVFAIARAIYFANYGLIFILGIYCSAFVFVFLTTLFQSGKEKVAINKDESPVIVKELVPMISVRSKSADV